MVGQPVCVTGQALAAIVHVTTGRACKGGQEGSIV